MKNTFERAELFERFIDGAVFELTGRPINNSNSYADYDYCNNQLGAITIMCGRILGFESKEFNYINDHLKSHQGLLFIGPIKKLTLDA